MQTALYPTLLGSSWHELHDELRRFHIAEAALHAVGVFRVLRGSNWLTRMVARLARLPAAGEAVDIRLAVTPSGDGEEWRRLFAGHLLVSKQYLCSGGLLGGTMGMTETRFQLEVVEHALHYRATSAALCLGKMRIRLPRWLCPRITACERVGDEVGQIIVNVEILLPLLGRLIAYAGTLKSVKDAQP